MSVQVYLIRLSHPTRRIALVDADITQSKWVWAHYKDRRYLVGSSAFFTSAAAGRAKAALLLKLLKCEFFRWRYWHTYAQAEQQLKSYQMLGVKGLPLVDLTAKAPA